MAITKLKMRSQGEDFCYSPFTGQPSAKNNDVNKDDPSLVFCYIDDVGEYQFTGENPGIDEEVHPLDLTEGVDLIIEVDDGVLASSGFFGYRNTF